MKVNYFRLFQKVNLFLLLLVIKMPVVLRTIMLKYEVILRISGVIKASACVCGARISWKKRARMIYG